MKGLARFGRTGVSLLSLASIASCGALIEEGTVVGGETHFLVSCEKGCGPGLTCLAGACTRRCEPEFSSCSELSTAASCVSAPDGSSEPGPFAGTCDVPCAVDADCATLGPDHLCRSGACRAEAGTSQMALSSASAALVRSVDVDTCQSGLLWVGGDRGSAEMRPGSDCVGCHRETGARPLALGGTVYASPSWSREHAADCFGLEGLEVVVTDADGRRFSMRTNRAGNFYLEGNAEDLAMPYSAELPWIRKQEEVRTRMFAQPAYGGCGRCHGNRSAQPSQRRDFADPDWILPAGVIAPAGLYPD